MRICAPAHAIAREEAAPALVVGEHRGDRLLVERDGRFVALRNRDELRRQALAGRERRAVHDREPGRIGRVALERAARHRIASLAAPRAGGGERHHARGVERVGERAVLLLAAEQHAREGLEAQVRRVGVRDREQILRVDVALPAQLGGDAAREEVLLELGVVRDHDAALEGRLDRLGELFDARRRLDVGVVEAREALHGARQRGLRPHQTLERRDARVAGIDEHGAELEDLGARVALEPGGLEVDERERAQRRREAGERFDLDPDLARERPRADEGREDARHVDCARLRLAARCACTSRGLRSPAARCALRLHVTSASLARRRCHPCIRDPGG